MCVQNQQLVANYVRNVCEAFKDSRHTQITRNRSNIGKVGLLDMESSNEVKSSDASTQVGVVAISGEPAIVINGVPDPSPDFLNDIAAKKSVTETILESSEHYGQGEWLKGREVLKKFGRKCYKGKVHNYDSETNWYEIIYEDGDSEEMELCDLQTVMVPLDIKSSLRTWLLKLTNANGEKHKSQRKEKNKVSKEKNKAMKKKKKAV